MQRMEAKATVSDLSHHQGKVLFPIDATDIRLTRRDGEDVLVSTVTRVAAERSSIAALMEVVQRTGERAVVALSDGILRVYPWTRSLPEADRKAFVSRYMQVLADCVAHTDFQPLAILLNQWAYTASVYKDKTLLAALQAPIQADPISGQPAEMPGTARTSRVKEGPRKRVRATRPMTRRH